MKHIQLKYQIQNSHACIISLLFKTRRDSTPCGMHIPIKRTNNITKLINFN